MSAFRYRMCIVALLCLVLGLTAFDRPTRAQQSAPPSNDVMTALLQEVHGLRMAMEHSAAMAPRVQLTLARLNIEEQRIAQLAAQLDRARQELTNIGLGVRATTDRLESLEKELQATTDEKKRRDIEDGMAGLKSGLKTQTAAEEAARARENDAIQALSTEQNRWIELNARLDELERSLAPIR